MARKLRSVFHLALELGLELSQKPVFRSRIRCLQPEIDAGSYDVFDSRLARQMHA